MDNPAAAPDVMPEPAVQKLISDTISSTLPGAIKAAMEPLMKTTTMTADAVGQLVDGARKAADAKAIDADLGPYPIGRKVRALAAASLAGFPGDIDCAVSEVKKHWPTSFGDATLKWLSHVKTSLTAGTAATAGDMVMPSFDPEWIALLRNNAVIRGICRTIPMPRGATSRRRQTGAGTAYYIGEGDNITVSNQTVGRINLSYKKLTALSVVSNDLLRFSSSEADRLVQEDLLQVVGLREDRAFLVGNPPTDAGSPQGIRYQTASSNVNASAGTSLSNFQSDLTTAVANVQKNNVPATESNSYWIMSPATKWTIYALATTTGDWVFANELSQGRLLGFKVLISTNLNVSNSFIGASAGLVFFVHGPSMEIHDSMMRTVGVYPGGAYYDATSAAVLSGISRDETVITCISEHDFAQVYDTAASVLTGYAT